jgi:hypothetical protein
MNKSENPQFKKSFADEYGNLHYLADELARGGQGVVFRTKDADLAIKQPLDAIRTTGPKRKVARTISEHPTFAHTFPHPGFPASCQPAR